MQKNRLGELMAKSITNRLSNPASRRRRIVWICVSVMLALHVALAFSGAVGQSTTCDEIAHLTAGYVKWKTGDFRMVPEHPPLAQLWAALPLCFMDVKLPTLNQQSWWVSDQWKFGAAWFYEIGNDPQRLLAAGRFMIALLSAGLGLIVYYWSRRLFGEAGGLISLGLFVFCPTILANGALVTTDIAAGLFLLLAVMMVWKTLHRVTIGTVLVSGVVLGCLFISKMSAFLIVPMYAAMLFVRLVADRPFIVRVGRERLIASRWKRVQAHAWVIVAQMVLVAGVIWIGHGARFSAMRESVAGRDHLPLPDYSPPEGADSWEPMLEQRGMVGDAVDLARRARLLPEAYLYGFLYALDMTRNSDAFLNGRRSVNGFAAFFPYCFLVKSTLPSLVLLAGSALAIGMLVRQRGPSSSTLLSGSALVYELTPLAVLLAVYLLTAVTGSFNIGHRHILPVYGPLYILAGLLAAGALWRNKAWACGVVAVVALHAGASLRAWPHYLAFFNTLAGGPAEGYRHLVDSSLDWGQDLNGLQHWLDRNGSAELVYLSYLGNGSPEYLGIKAEPLPTCPYRWKDEFLRPYRPGIYCISASNLQLVRIIPFSRWTPEQETLYQRCVGRIREMQAGTARPGAVQDINTVPDTIVVRMRFARLCAALRGRKADGDAGHSILIHRLSENEINSILFGPAPEVVPDEAEGVLRMGDEFAASGSPVFAERYYRLSLKLQPGQARVHHNLGVVLGKLGRTAESVSELREAVRLKPDFAEAYENLGNALAVAGNYAEAAANYESAIRLIPRKVELYGNLADVYSMSGQLDKATPLYERVILMRPRWPEPHATLGSVYAQRGDFESAIRQFQEAISLRPGWAAMYNNIGLIYAEQKKFEPAAASFLEAIRREPGDAGIHVNLGNSYLELRRMDDAIRHFQEALRLQPGLPEAATGLQNCQRLKQASGSS